MRSMITDTHVCVDGAICAGRYWLLCRRVNVSVGTVRSDVGTGRDLGDWRLALYDLVHPPEVVPNGTIIVAWRYCTLPNVT